MRRRVRVLGIGVVSAFGTSQAAFRDALLEGRSAIAPVSGFDVTGCRSGLAAQLTDFEPTAWVPPMKLRRLDRTGAYAVAVTRLALDDAARTTQTGRPLADDTAGVVLGTWTAGGQSTEQYLAALFGGGPTSAPAMLFDSTVGNSAAGLIGLEFKLRGPNVTLSQKEASGLGAIVSAVELLRAGKASGLIAGGVDAIYETFFKGHDRFGVMSAEPSFSNRLAPFDKSRSGFVLGEGGFGLWLECGDRAPSDYGEILGAASGGAAIGVNEWPNRPEPLIRVMRLALADAGVESDNVDVIYASANATHELDAVESQALSALFAGRRAVITSLKGALGEFGASGGAACAAALLCGREGKVPPIAGLTDPETALASLRPATRTFDAPGPIVLVNSFASGGSLFSAVLRVAA